MALVLALAFLSTRPAFLRSRVRNVLAQELAELSDRQVQIGEVSGNLLTGIQVDNLALADEGGFQQGAILAAGRVTIKYDLPAVLHGRLKAPASIKEITLDRVYARVERAADGEINLAQLFKRKVAKRLPLEERFQPLITIRDSVVDVVAAGAGRYTLRTRLAPVNGTVKINAVGPTRLALTTRSADGAFGALSLRASADFDQQYFLAEGRLENLPLGRWASLVPDSSPVRLLGGSATADFQLWSVPSGNATVGPVALPPLEVALPKVKTEFGYSAQVALQGVNLGLPAPIGGEVHVAGARVQVTPQGVEIVNLDASWDSLLVRATGWLYDLSHPRADLHLEAHGVDLAVLRRRLLAVLPEPLPFDLAGNGDLTVDAVGPLQNLNATLALSLPEGGVLTTDHTGEVVLGSVRLQAELLDSAEPAVIADLTATGATLQTSFVLTALSESPRPADSEPAPELSLRQVGALQAETLLAGSTSVVSATVNGVEGAYEGRDFTALSADLAMAGNTLRLPRLEADVLGGHVQAEALVALPAVPGGKPRVIANGKADNLNLASLPPSLLGDADGHLRGVASSDFGITWQGDRGRVAGTLLLRDAAYDDYTANRIEALASAEFGPHGHWQVSVPLADVQAPAGRFSVTGTAEQQGPVDFRADLSGVDLALLPVKGDKPSGYAYGQVRFTGSLREPRFSGQAVVFRPSYQDYQASAVITDFSAQPRSLAAADLFPPAQGQVEAYASYDSAVAHADLTLTGPAGSEEAPTLAGDLRLSGLRLASLPDLLRAHWNGEFPPMTGLAQVSATLSGTTSAPVARGQAELSQVDYEHFFVNAVRAPFTFEWAPETQEYLVVKGGTLSTAGASLSFDGALRDLRGDWSFTAQAQASDVHLERLAAVLPVRLPLGGEVLIPQITVTGSAAGVTGEGRLLAPELTVADSQVRGLDTRFLIEKGQVKLERTTLHAAGGTLQAELTYTIADGSLQGAVEAANVDLSSGLALAAPLAAAAAKTEETYATTERLWQSWSLRSHGLLSAAVQFHGPPDQLIGTATIGLTEAAYEEKPVPDVRGTFVFDAGRRALTDLDVELQSGQALMTVYGQAELDGALSLVADATNVDLASWREWFPTGLGLGGVAGITVQAQGTTAAPEITASVDVLSASVRGVHFDLVSIPIMTVADSGIDLDRIIFKRGERQVLGSGHLPFSWDSITIPKDEPLRFIASLENTDLSFFPPIISEFTRYASTAAQAGPSPWLDMTASGTVNSRLQVSGTLRQPNIEGYLKLADGAIARPTWKTPLTDLSADLTIRSVGAGNLVEIRQFSGRWDHTSLALTGSANLASLEREELARNTYDLALAVDAEGQPLWPGQSLTGLHGTIALTTAPGGVQMLRFTDMAGTVGKGHLSLAGGVGLTSFDPETFANNDFDLQFQATEVPVNYPGILRALVDSGLRVSNPSSGQPAVISGSLLVDNGTLGFSQADGGSESKGPLVGLGPGVPDFGLDVKVGLGSRLALRTLALVAPFLPTAEAVVATGSLLAPRVRGSLQTSPGEGSLPGSSFTVRGLNIAYSLVARNERGRPPYPLVLTGEYHGAAEQTLPYVQVDGRNIGPVHLSMTIDGDLAEVSKGPVVKVTAEPPLTQEQVALLVGLQGLVPGGTTDFNELLSQRFLSVLGRGFREALFTPIETQVRKALGLSEFTVLFSFGQPLEVRMGKYLTDNFLVTYRYSLISPRNEQWNLGISYDLPVQKLRVTYSTNESGENQFRVGRAYSF